jgi:hypothetical protein
VVVITDSVRNGQDLIAAKQPHRHHEIVAVVAFALTESGTREFSEDDVRRAYIRAGVRLLSFQTGPDRGECGTSPLTRNHSMKRQGGLRPGAGWCGNRCVAACKSPRQCGPANLCHEPLGLHCGQS